MELIGKKVKIRNFENDDIEQFLELVQDENNHKLAGLEYTEDVNLGRDLLDMYQRRDGAYAVVSNDTNKLIGIIEINKRGESPDLLQTREIGFVIDRKYRNQGLAKDAVMTMIDYGFKQLNLTEIWASTEKDNLAPQKLLELLNFKYVYEVDQALPYTEQPNPVKYYLLKNDSLLVRNS